MLIKLSDTLQIRGIPHNFVLEEKKVSQKTGEEYESPLGYYPTLESLLRGMLHNKMQESDVENIKQLRDEMEAGIREIVEKIELLQDNDKRTHVLVPVRDVMAK